MAESQKSSFFRNPGLGIVAGLVVGVAVVVGMTLGGFLQHEETATEIPTPQAAIDFAEAYGDMSEGSYVQKRTTQRLLNSGESSVSESIVAQYGSDSVAIAGGTITIIRNGERQVCPLPEDGANVDCPAPQPFDAEEAADEQIRQVEQLVDEEDGAYNVTTTDNRCFQLSLTTIGLQADAGDLPWGNRAEFCFEDETNALRTVRIERDGGADAVTTSYLSAVVDEAVLDRLARGDQSDVS